MVIPLARQTQVTASVPQVTLVQPSQSGPDPVVAAIDDGAQRASKLTQALAQREKEQLDQLYKVQIAAEVSEFEVQERAELIKLNAEGTGDESFSAVVMRNFQERASKVGEKYSEEFKREIKAKLLPIQETIGVGAMTLEQRKHEEKIVASMDTYINTAVNKVRFGASDEGTIFQEAEGVLASVPDNLRLGLELKLRENVRVASMGRELEANPAAFMQQVQSGAFNDVDPTQVNRLYDAAERTLLAAQERAERREREYREQLASDPYAAVRARLTEQGEVAPSKARLLQMQIESGIPSWGTAVISKQKAILYLDGVRNAQTPGEAAAFLSSLKQEAGVESPEDWGVLQRNMRQFAKAEGLPHLATVLEVLDPETARLYDDNFRHGVFEMMRDPKAADSVAALVGDEEAKKVRLEAKNALAEFNKMRERSGVEPSEIRRDSEFLEDAALIASRRAASQGRPFDVTKAVRPPESKYTHRMDNHNAYIVPADLSSTFSADALEGLKMDIIDSGEIAVPLSMPSAMRASVDMKREAGWFNGPSENTLVLKVRGYELYGKDGKPVVVPLDSLTVGEVQRKTSSSPRALSIEFRRLVKKPTLQQMQTPGTLLPPTTSGARDESLFKGATPPGDINILPPPTYE